MAPKVKPFKAGPSIIKAKTQEKLGSNIGTKWWREDTEKMRADALVATAVFLKQNQLYRYRQAGMHARLYGNVPLFGIMGNNYSRLQAASTLPVDRPTMNVVQSCVDTLVSRLTQSRPKPTFLTDNADHKQRKLAKQLNAFSQGELYRTKMYEQGPKFLTDAAVIGTGCVKIFRGQDDKVGAERTIVTELMVDENDAIYGKPRTMYQVKLVDRLVLAETYPKYKKAIENAEQAFPDNSSDSSRTISDQILVVEGWHLPSGPDAKDGLHMIACSAGSLGEEEYKEDDFPFVFLNYSDRMLGFWGQSLAEQLLGTQVEINKLLITISQSINLVGVPRVFVEDGSKIVKAHLNNQIGAIVTYRGTKPEYTVAQCVPQEVYAQLQRLIDYAYQQSGISALSASSKKPAGLDSGAALREFDDIQSDRFATLNKRYDQFFIETTDKMIKMAAKIAEETGKYSTVYPNKNGTREIDLPVAGDMLKDTYVIQCFNSSALPRDPAGRLQKITEMIQAGMLTMQEGRRLLDYPDLEQTEMLANAMEERILQRLDEIVEDGKYTPPDPFMDPNMCIDLAKKYYNLYEPAKLPEKRCEMLRTFSTQAQALMQSALPPPVAGTQPGAGPVAPPVPMSPSPLVPQQ